MAGLIQTCSFTNVFGSTFDFLGSNSRVSAFEPSPSTRGDARPRMQAHGSNPRVPYWAELPIHQEGWIVVGSEGSALIAARDSFLDIVVGDLTVPNTLSLSGTLTIKYEGWTENASQTVIVESAESHLRVDTGTRRGCPYMVQWVAVTPYFVGASSGDPYNL
jgi:hypothetical protein